MAYPDDIDSFREIENIPGLSYDAGDKRTLFMEDLQAAWDSIQAIENFVGANDAGAASPLFQLFLNLIYPVGRITHFADGTDPNDTYTWQTWEVWGPGRVLVGQDASDPNFDTLGEETGSNMQASDVSVSQQPDFADSGHDHSLSNAGWAYMVVGGGHIQSKRVSVPQWTTTRVSSGSDVSAAENQTVASGLGGATDSDNANLSRTDDVELDNAAVNNIQKSKVGVRWVRTA